MKKLFKLPQKQYGSGVPSSFLTVGMHPRLSLTAEAVPHPSPYHRIAILATKGALLLRPVIPGVPDPHSYIRIPWGNTFAIEEVAITPEDTVNESWEKAAIVLGILGCLNLTAGSYLLVTTAKNNVGHFLHNRYEFYSVKSISAIPMQELQARAVLDAIVTKYNHLNLPKEYTTVQSVYDSSAEPFDLVAETSQTHTSKVKFAEENDIKIVSPTANSELRSTSPTPSTLSRAASGATTPGSERDESSVISSILASRLSLWASGSRRREASLEARSVCNSSCSENPDEALQEILEATSPVPGTLEERQSELDQKVLKQTIKEFSKGVMFFAYNFDLTTSLQHKQREVARLRRRATSQCKEHDGAPIDSPKTEHCEILAEPHSTLPLWQRVTKQFWWNEHMLQPFIDAGLHSYILPVMQGYCQMASFRIPEVSSAAGNTDVQYLVISRRSRERAGLRYQRRGVDEDANVANFVETESIVHMEREGRTNVFSYIQIRGSIPLFWTQFGYNLKPPPILDPDRTHDQNLVALRHHFAKTISRYGPHVVMNLAEQHGKEASVTHAYRDYVGELASKDVRYFEYDFHKETKGMHYENLTNLIESLRKVFGGQGFMWISDDILMSEQKSVFRVNCIDCLDRTNVVQSAFARHVLLKQLSAVALLNSTDTDRSELDIVFNDVWANNGDAISRAYAGTSALKGDYTRTGRRDLAGMLNDGMNSLARMYASTFSDWFSQAVIDFILGNRSVSVFAEFLEKLQSTDPRERVRAEAIRADAIADSVSLVLSECERLLGGWTLLSPLEFNTKLSEKLEEKILLLSVQALYIVSYDFTLENVVRYSRIPLKQITRIVKGEYILSPLEEGSRNPLQNHGFVIHYLTAGESMRVTNYTLRNNAEMNGMSVLDESTNPGSRPSVKRASNVLSRILRDTTLEQSDTIIFVAFKALPVDPVRSRRTTGGLEESANDLSWAKTCKEVVDAIVDTISQAALDGKNVEGFVTSEPIVSLEEARRATTVLTKMEYEIKRLLWLGS